MKHVATRGPRPPTLAGYLPAPATGAKNGMLGQNAVAALLDAGLYGPLREFLSRPGKGFRGLLTELSYKLAGGKGEAPAEMSLIIESLHAGSLIVDDIEDASEMRRGAQTLHRIAGMPVALNAGNFLYFWPHRLLKRTALGPAARLKVHEAMGECLMQCHEGQALDLTVRLSQVHRRDMVAVAHAISVRKSGALMGLACALGGIAAGASPLAVRALAAFGEQVGIGLQMLDDLSGVINPARADKGVEDLAGERPTWAWAVLAESLEPESYAHMLDERASLSAPAELSLLLDRMRFPLSVHGPARVTALFEAAVHSLFEVLGASPLRPTVEHELRRLQRRFLEG